MDEFSDIWIDQCQAARDIREVRGTRKALGYLVREKFLNYIRASDSNPSWAAKMPLFAAEIRRIFTTDVRAHEKTRKSGLGSLGFLGPSGFLRALGIT